MLGVGHVAPGVLWVEPVPPVPPLMAMRPRVMMVVRMRQLLGRVQGQALRGVAIMLGGESATADSVMSLCEGRELTILPQFVMHQAITNLRAMPCTLI